MFYPTPWQQGMNESRPRPLWTESFSIVSQVEFRFPKEMRRKYVETKLHTRLCFRHLRKLQITSWRQKTTTYREADEETHQTD